MDSWEKTGTEVVVKVLVLAHLKHLLPLLDGHLILYTFGRLVFLTQVFTSELHKVQHGYDYDLKYRTI